ncbi:MAG: DUF1587 domain-containing protein, partial [Verrucomicrobiota bacterium]
MSRSERWVACVGLVLLTLLSARAAADFDPATYVQNHCTRCHGNEKQKGDRRFDQLKADFTSTESLETWQEILDVINGGEMPPEDEAQPPAEETEALIDLLTSQLEAARRTLAPDRAQVRRLNRYEYLDTIRDLCGVNTESFDPTTTFPADERVDGFENIGEELVLSDYQLQQYLEAGSQVIDKASRTNTLDQPLHKIFAPNDLCDRKFHFRPQISLQVNVDGRYVDVGHGDRMSDRVVPGKFKGVPTDGYYTLRVKAEGINREHPYEPHLLGIDRDEPIKMEVLVADPTVGSRLAGNATDRSVAVVPLRDHEAEIHEFRVWMDQGFVPVVRYINGPQPIKAVLFKIAPKYHKEVLPSNWRSGTDRKPAEEKERYLSDVYEGPRMRIHRIELEGPERSPPEGTSRGILFGPPPPENGTFSPDEAMKAFLFRAFRRPPTDAEIARYRQFMAAREKKGDSPEAALLTPSQRSAPRRQRSARYAGRSSCLSIIRL